MPLKRKNIINSQPLMILMHKCMNDKSCLNPGQLLNMSLISEHVLSPGCKPVLLILCTFLPLKNYVKAEQMSGAC